MTDGGPSKKGWFIAGCGGILALLCTASALFWSVHVIEDSGAISADEAMPGALGSCCCLVLSGAILIAGIVVGIMDRKKAQGGS